MRRGRCSRGRGDQRERGASRPIVIGGLHDAAHDGIRFSRGREGLHLFAPDRRICVAYKRDSERPKIFPIPQLRAGIGDYGLATASPNGRSMPMARWLSEFLARNTTKRTLPGLATALATELERDVLLANRKKCVSGFHLAGLDCEDKPEFWFVRNVSDDRVTLLGGYEARQDFAASDSARFVPGQVLSFRNGDLRAHVAAWEQMDASFGALLNTPDFEVGTAPSKHAEWVAFKLETVARFNERFSTKSIIGRPIDCLVITSSGVEAITPGT